MRRFIEILRNIDGLGVVLGGGADEDGFACRVMCPVTGATLQIIASWGGSWDHVSVVARNRCPVWEEMAWVKDTFFAPEEAAMQLHPRASQYVNNHKHCLHIWRPQDAAIPEPPVEFVGIK